MHARMLARGGYLYATSMIRHSAFLSVVHGRMHACIHTQTKHTCSHTCITTCHMQMDMHAYPRTSGTRALAKGERDREQESERYVNGVRARAKITLHRRTVSRPFTVMSFSSPRPSPIRYSVPPPCCAISHTPPPPPRKRGAQTFLPAPAGDRGDGLSR